MPSPLASSQFTHPFKNYSQGRRAATLGFLLCLPFALSACSGGANEVYVPYSFKPAVNESISPSGQQIEVDFSLANPVGQFKTGDEVTFNLTWTNSSQDEMKGSLEASISAPRGYELVSYNGCDKVLVNNLICRFKGGISPGASVSRTLVYEVTDDASKASDFVLRSISGNVSVAVKTQ